MQTIMKTRKLKRRLALFVAVIMTLSLWTAVPLQASADTDDITGLVYTISGDEATITGYNGSAEELIIPETLGNKPVTTILADGFRDSSLNVNTTLKSIMIPASVTKIDTTEWRQAFSYCYALASITVAADNSTFYSDENGVLFSKDRSILVCYPAGKEDTSYTIPDGVTVIGPFAFQRAASLDHLTIPANVTSINSTAFVYCTADFSVAANNQYYISDNGILFNKDKTSLVRYPMSKEATSYILPDSVTTINHEAFSDCAFTSITIPDSVTTIGNRAFGRCRVEAITIPENVTILDGNVFQNSKTLTSVTIQGATEIGAETFRGCTVLAEVNMPNVTGLGNMSFADCPELTEITIPGSAKNIDVNAFTNDAKLAKVTLDEGVTSISANMFASCPSLATITLPDSLTSIGSAAFTGTALTSITFPKNVTTIGNQLFYGSNTLTSVTIQGATAIGSAAFRSCAALTEINMPNVKSLGTMAFADCPKLEEITIPGSVENNIGNSLFLNCTDLKIVTIDEGVASISASMFTGCSSLTTVSLPDSLTSIGTGAFSGTALTSITFPKNVTTIANNLFYSNNTLTSVTIEGNATIGDSAFRGCSVLKKVEIANVKSLGSMAFYDCIALEEVTIQGAESVGNSLFSNDKVLKKVTLGEGVTSLSNSMFSACNALETVTIQGPVTSIGNSAFQNCWALTEIKLPDTVTSIGTYAFYENRALTEVTIPAGVTAIASNVFQNCSSLATITILGKETTIEASAFYSIASGAKFWCYDDTPAKTYATTRAVIMLESISLDKTVSGLTLKKGTTETGSMAITTTPASVSTGTLETLTGTNVEWTSSNPNVATVDATGTTVTVIAQGFGSAEITAKTTPHSGIPMEARATVTVDPPDNTQLYTLTVNSGSGGGDFPATAMVDITANTPTPGQEFDKWTNSGGVVVNPNAAQTSVAILMAAATVTANYRFIMPAPIIDYEEEELTGLVNDGTYTFNGADGSASNTGTYDIDPGWIGKTIPIVKKAVSSVADSKTQSLAIPARPAQPTGIEKTDETIDEHEDGTMSGVTALMQYSDDAGDTWKDGDGEVIDELEPGDYLVRVKAVAGTSFASAPITVTIGDGVPQTRILTVTAPAFDDVKVGYTQPDAEYISILNEGNSPANITSVTVSGSDFVITGTTGTVGVDETNDNTWTIQPAASLTAGEYADTITVTYDGSAQTTADVSFTVNETYALTVENGEDATDDGPYVEGAEVEITANAPTSGKVFDKWTSEPEGVAFASETSATTTFTMPANAVTVTATYKNAPVNPPPAAETYALTVTDGTDNTNAGPYEEGAEVSITAGTAPEGQVFDTWTTSAGGTFTDATKESTSFTMPANAVTVTATYKDDPNGGNGEPGTDNPPDNPPQADNGWVKNDDGEWEYLTDGEAKTGWLYDTNYKAWYYLASDGVMQTGWDYVGGKWYYLASNGKMQTGWLKDNGSWYYLSGNGAMVASKWFKDTDGSWYYLSGNGKMLTGKQTIGGKAYTFKSNGVWVS